MRTGSLLVIFLTVFVDLLGFGIVLPVLPVYAEHFAQSEGYSAGQIGLIVGLLMSSFSAMQFLFAPVWGRFSDRIGRRPVLLIGLCGSTFFYAMFGVATMWRSLVGLFAARIGAGIACGTISTAQAYIADSTTKETRAKGMALIGASFALGFTLGPMLGAAALLSGDEAAFSPWPGYVASIFSGVALTLASFLLPESRQPGAAGETVRLFDWQRFRAAVAIPSIGLLLLTTFIAVFAFGNFEACLSLQIKQIADQHGTQAMPSSVLTRVFQWAEQRGFTHVEQKRNIAIYAGFTYLGIILTLAQGFLVRRLAGRIAEAKMAIVGAGLAMLGFAGLIWTAQQGDFDRLLVAMAIEVVGFAMVSPSLQSLISRRSSPELQGSMAGLSQSASALARIAGPVVAMPLFERSPAAPYMAALAVMIAALAMLIYAARHGHDYSA